MKKIILISLLLLRYGSVYSQKYSISGYVADSVTGEKLIGANIAILATKIGSTTDNYGFFSLTSNTAISEIIISYIGYNQKIIDLSTSKKTLIEIKLKPSNELNTITIKGIKENKIGLVSIPIRQLLKIPALLGEVDILKALTLTPGVLAGNEGSAGIFVRGGSPDQNLILLDGSPVYNVNHLSGFLSVFNPNSIKSIDLYKGAFPAQFGGKLSSVIDITMKDGDKKKFGGEYNVGIVNQNFTLNGPIKKDKSSFIFSGRYSNLGLTRLFQKSVNVNSSGESNAYQFYDLNFKYNTELSKKDHLFFSIYSGHDYFKRNSWDFNGLNKLHNISKINWGNITKSLRYNHIFNDKLIGKFSANTTNFITNQSGIQKNEKREVLTTEIITSSVKDFILSSRLDFFPTNNQKLFVGFDATLHNFNPVNTLIINKDSTKNQKNVIKANEYAAYLQSETRILNTINLDLGARYVVYEVNQKQYNSFEPRVAFSTQLTKDLMMKGSYSKMRQFVHLLTNNGLGISNDIWVPTTESIAPENATQFSLGLYKELEKQKVKISLEAYSKQLQSLIDFPEGRAILKNYNSFSQNILEKKGIGRVKGIELMVAKDKGNLNGWIAYTLSKSERKFDNINLGEWFPFKYDRRHVLNITGSYQLSKKWDLASSFIFQSGNAITLPTASYNSDYGTTRAIYNGRNQSRMPSYNRLDIGFTKKIKNGFNNESKLNFGVYNAYNKFNAYYLDLEQNVTVNVTQGQPVVTPGPIVVKQYALIPFLPYISYTSKF